MSVTLRIPPQWPRLAAQGWRLIQVTSRQLDEQPAEVAQRVREALRYRTS